MAKRCPVAIPVRVPLDDPLRSRVVIKIETVAPDAAIAAQIVRDYMVDVASRWYRRPATSKEVDQALHDEPYDDLQGLTGMLLVAVEDGRPLGCAGVRFLGNVAELTKAFTLPSYRGRGVGSQLLRAVEQACRERAVGTLRLDTRAALAETCAIYERNGFERVDAFSDESSTNCGSTVGVPVMPVPPLVPDPRPAEAPVASTAATSRTSAASGTR